MLGCSYIAWGHCFLHYHFHWILYRTLFPVFTMPASYTVSLRCFTELFWQLGDILVRVFFFIVNIKSTVSYYLIRQTHVAYSNPYLQTAYSKYHSQSAEYHPIWCPAVRKNIPLSIRGCRLLKLTAAEGVHQCVCCSACPLSADLLIIPRATWGMKSQVAKHNSMKEENPPYSHTPELDCYSAVQFP